MKRILIIAAVIFGILALFMGAVGWKIHSSRPQALLQRLRLGRGDREELIMRLDLARGDPVTPMIKAFSNSDYDPAFRAQIVELLFRRHLRTPEDRIIGTLKQALADTDTAVRRKAAKGFLTYADVVTRRVLASAVDDTDPEVRRYAYTAFLGGYDRRWRTVSVWDDMPDEDRSALVDRCRARKDKEQDPELQFLARSVVGRRIADLCVRSMELLQRAEPVEAEELLHQALQLDPDNRRAQIRMVRYLLTTGRKQEALRLAEEYHALMRIPELSSAPTIDGDPTDPAWEDAYTSDRFFLTVSRWVRKPSQGKSRFYIGHRQGRLYIAVLGYEDDLDKLVLKHTERDGDVWRDDCCELFLDPSDTQKDVWQFVINVGGYLHDSRGGVQAKDVRDFNANCEARATIHYDRGYWAAEFAVDVRELEDKPITKESLWGINIVRTRIGAGSEHCQWWPTFGQAHNYEYFPIAVFEVQ